MFGQINPTDREILMNSAALRFFLINWLLLLKNAKKYKVTKANIQANRCFEVFSKKKLKLTQKTKIKNLIFIKLASLMIFMKNFHKIGQNEKEIKPIEINLVSPFDIEGNRRFKTWVLISIEAGKPTEANPYRLNFYVI